MASHKRPTELVDSEDESQMDSPISQARLAAKRQRQNSTQKTMQIVVPPSAQTYFEPSTTRVTQTLLVDEPVTKSIARVESSAAPKHARRACEIGESI